MIVIKLNSLLPSISLPSAFLLTFVCNKINVANYNAALNKKNQYDATR